MRMVRYKHAAPAKWLNANANKDSATGTGPYTLPAPADKKFSAFSPYTGFNRAGPNLQKNEAEEEQLTEAIQDNRILIYPNPTEGLFTFENLDPEMNGAIEVYDIYGRRLITRQLREQKVVINLQAFSSGLYLVKLSTENGYNRVTRLVKQWCVDLQGEKENASKAIKPLKCHFK